jgi:polyhydroxyalkanoate synthesis repressor PhaR
MAQKKSDQRVIKKYPNRRLYDTASSSYITIADVKQLVVRGEVFRVRDAKTDEDLTRAILLQIILEEEAGGAPLFSEAVLEQMIRVYGNAMQGVMGAMMERNMQVFAEMQSKLAQNTKSFSRMSGMGSMPGMGGMPNLANMPQSFSPEAWMQFMQGANPMFQGLMNNYTEHSKTLFAQMQEQMAQFAKQGKK